MNKPTPDAKPAPHINIQIDREHFAVDTQVMTGAQIRDLPSPPIAETRDLFQVVPGGQDLKVADNESIGLKSGMRFFSAPGQINPGSHVAAVQSN